MEETCGCLRPSVSDLHRPSQQRSADAVTAFTVGDITAGHVQRAPAWVRRELLKRSNVKVFGA